MNIQKNINKIHKNSLGKSNWYNDLHDNPHSSFRHWLVLAAVTGAITISILSLTNQLGRTLSYTQTELVRGQSKSNLIFAKNNVARVLGISTDQQHGVGSVISDNGTVYYIDYLGQKRPYTSLGAFLSYGFNSQSQIVPANAQDATLPIGAYIPPQDGSLVNDHGTIYIITKGQKAGFASADAFKTMGFKFSSVIQGDTSFISNQSVITTAKQGHPLDTLVSDGGTIYLLTSLGRVAIPSQQVFDSWGYSWSDVVPANSYDLAMPISPNVLLSRPDGRLSAYGYVQTRQTLANDTSAGPINNNQPASQTGHDTNPPVAVAPPSPTPNPIVSAPTSGHNNLQPPTPAPTPPAPPSPGTQPGHGSGNTPPPPVSPPIQNPPSPLPPVPAPIIPAPTNLPAHPRVWMTADRLTQLRAQITANTIRWQRVKAGADAQISMGANGSPALLPDLCLAYLGSNDVRYAQEAGAILTAYAVESNNLQGDSGYDYRFNMPLITEALDWCYNGLTLTQRQQTATWLMNRADWVWPETNSARIGGWAVGDPANNYYWGFMMTGPAALAAAGDDTGSGAISGTNRPAYHIALAMSHWNNIVTPFLAGRGAGGAWLEGTGYDSGGRLALFADAFQTSGTSIYNTWFNADLRWRLASTMPGGAYHMPLGDQARVSDGPSFTYDRIAVLDLLSVGQPDPTLAAQIQYWLNMVGQIPTSEFNQVGTLADELLRYNPNAPTASDLNGLPNDYYASGAGDFIYRQSWTDPNTTNWVFQSGPIQSHNSGAANSLRIWKGSFWVSADANIYSSSGIEQSSADFNTLTVGGNGQVLYDNNDSKIVGTPQISSTLIAVRGQASAAYNTRPDRPNSIPVPDYLRTVSYLPAQDTFVIVDRVTAVDPTQAKVWRWHTQSAPQISGNTFTLSNPGNNARCFGSVLLPTSATLGTQPFTLGSGGTSSNAVTVTLPTGSASNVVVTVLQCTTGQSAPYQAMASSDGTNVTATIGSSQVVIPLNETQAVSVR